MNNKKMQEGTEIFDRECAMVCARALEKVLTLADIYSVDRNEAVQRFCRGMKAIVQGGAFDEYKVKEE